MGHFPPVLHDKNRWIFTSDDDELQVTRMPNGSYMIEAYRAWAGDTETGFGETTTVEIPWEVGDMLAKWLTR